MRWDFSEEERVESSVTFEEFSQICSEFLVNAIRSGDWYIWIAEISGSLVSHMNVAKRTSILHSLLACKYLQISFYHVFALTCPLA